MLCYVISAGAAEKMRVRFYVHDIIYVHHIISILVCVQSGATCTIVYMHYIMSIVVCVQSGATCTIVYMHYIMSIVVCVMHRSHIISIVVVQFSAVQFTCMSSFSLDLNRSQSNSQKRSALTSLT
jgi:hypothetical protein